MKPAPADRGIVVIVDDDEAVLRSLRFLLEAEGHRVLSFANPSCALDRAKDVHGSCMVIDYIMPGMSGLDLIGGLRHRQITMPVIMVTSVVTPALKEQANLLGVAEVFEKPLQGDAFLDSVSRALLAA